MIPVSTLAITSLLSGLVSAAGIMILLRVGALGLPLDQPNERSLHRQPVPRIGGLGVIAGIVLGWVLAAPEQSILLLAATVLLALVSLADDIRSLPVIFRLLFHTAAAVAAVSVVAPAVTASAVIWVAALVWMTNLFNFMDGSDGLAGGMALLGFGCYGLAALGEGDVAMAAISWSIAAAATGFLVFNFHPARVFLGDCGSIPIGFLAGALGLLGWRSGIWPVWFPCMVFAPFVVDATATLLRRLWRGEPFWQAHRDHYYQRLVRMGWGHRKTALFGYGLMTVSASIALSIRSAHSATQMSVLGLVAALFIGLMWTFDRRWNAFLLESGKGI
jgi:UDP-N-acetylmuramyl pentapeptide phosphotransferase/UDP-N-acetylglucosamine-1-phosphate transferase